VTGFHKIIKILITIFLIYCFSFFLPAFADMSTGTLPEPDMDGLSNFNLQERLDKGRELFLAGDLEKSFLEFQVVLYFFPENPVAHYHVGLIYLLKSDYEKAVYHLERARAYDPYSILLSLELGNLYLSIGEFQKAQVEYERILRLFPDNREAIKGLALVYLNTEQYDKAIKQDRKSVV